MLEDYNDYDASLRQRPPPSEERNVAYTDKYGIRRHRGRVGQGSMGPDIRDAAFDIWGNFLSGRDVRGGEVVGKTPITGVDRWKMANDPEWAAAKGYDTANLSDRYRLTPGIDRYKKQFSEKNPQLTSSGQRWEDAVAAARNQDVIRNQYDAQRMQQYRDFQLALQRRRGQAPYGGYGQYGYTAGYQGGYGGGGYGINPYYGGGGYGGGAIRGGSTGSAYSSGSSGSSGSYSIGGSGIRGGSMGSAYS
jgi:hypothetical protein